MGYLRLPRSVYILSGGRMLLTLTLQMTLPFLAYFLSRMAYSPADIGAVLGTGMFAGVVGNLVAGVVGDRVGPRFVVLASVLGEALGFVGFAALNGFAALTLAAIVFGFSNGAFWGPQGALIAELTRAEERVQAYGFTYVMANVGAALGPLLGAALVGLGRPDFFAIGAVLLIVLDVALARMLPRVHSTPHVAGAPLGRLLRDRPFPRYLVGQLCTQLAYNFVASFLVLVLEGRSFHSPADGLAYFMAENAVLCVLLTFPVSHLLRRWRRTNAMALSGLVSAAGLVLVAMSRDLGLLLCASFVFTLGEVMLAPTSSAYVATMAPPDLRTSYMAIASLAMSLGNGLSPVVGGVILGALGGTALYLFGAVVFVLSSVFFLWTGLAPVRASPAVAEDL